MVLVTRLEAVLTFWKMVSMVVCVGVGCECLFTSCSVGVGGGWAELTLMTVEWSVRLCRNGSPASGVPRQQAAPRTHHTPYNIIHTPGTTSTDTGKITARNNTILETVRVWLKQFYRNVRERIGCLNVQSVMGGKCISALTVVRLWHWHWQCEIWYWDIDPWLWWWRHQTLTLTLYSLGTWQCGSHADLTPSPSLTMDKATSNHQSCSAPKFS